MRQILLRVFIVIAVVFLVSCSRSERFSPERYIPDEQLDTLLADIVTIIGRKPSGADWQNKYDPRFRKYYINHSTEFSFEYFLIDKSGNHFFYIIRPARHVDGDRRGVGGRFIINTEGKIDDFEEVFNTPVKSGEELREIGMVLFRELVRTGDVEKYKANRNFVEWPDDRLKYDKTMKEWRYDVD